MNAPFSPSPSSCSSKQSIQSQERSSNSRMTSPHQGVDPSRNNFNFGINPATDQYASNALGGTEQQELIDLKLKIIKQQQKLDKLSSKLRRCQSDNEAIKAEKLFFKDELALDQEIIDGLRQENYALRQQMRQPEKIFGSDIAARTSQYPYCDDTADATNSMTLHSDSSRTPKVGDVETIGNIANTNEINRPDERPSTQDKNKGFRRDYSLGDTIRSPSHMIIEPTSDRTNRAVDSLQEQDFAFVKRSDGSYSYAILANRKINIQANPTKTNEANKKEHEYMIFVIDSLGGTKTLRKSLWSGFVRLVSMENQDGR